MWSIVQNFSFFLLYFFNLSFSLFFLSSSFLWMPFHVIYHDFCTILTIHVWVRCWELLPVPSHISLNLLLLAVRLLVYCSGITSTLMRPESWEAFNVEVAAFTDICYPSSSSFTQYIHIPLSWNTFNILY